MLVSQTNKSRCCKRTRRLLAPIGLLIAFCLPLISQAESLDVEQVLAEDSMLMQGQGVRAQLVPVQHSVISSELSARIESVGFQIGDHVEKGDVLVEFDCAALFAQQKIYQSQKRVSELNLSIKQRLLELNNVGAQELGLATAEFESSSAQLEIVDLQVGQCVIEAPYRSVVVARNADPYEYVNIGDELVEIMGTPELEVLLVAPSEWLKWLRKGSTFNIYVDEIESSFSGSIVRLGGRVDPVSQTILLWGRVDNPSNLALPGMSGSIRFDETQ